MPVSIIIARWIAIGMLVFGLSHLLYPSIWTKLMLPLREQRSGGFLLATLSLPIGLIIIVGHNVWVWDLSLIITILGWGLTLKSISYLLFPTFHSRVMPAEQQMTKGFQVVGALMIFLGTLSIYDSFFQR